MEVLQGLDVWPEAHGFRLQDETALCVLEQSVYQSFHASVNVYCCYTNEWCINLKAMQVTMNNNFFLVLLFKLNYHRYLPYLWFGLVDHQNLPLATFRHDFLFKQNKSGHNQKIETPNNIIKVKLTHIPQQSSQQSDLRKSLAQTSCSSFGKCPVCPSIYIVPFFWIAFPFLITVQFS